MSITYPAWLGSVHHDGSARFASQLTPAYGDLTTIFLRMNRAAPIEQVVLRYFPNGEQAFLPMKPDRDEGHVRWWTTTLPMMEPVVHYRFVLQAADGIWWYSAAGVSDFEPLDNTDFRILVDYQRVEWLEDAVFYQVFPETFANGDPSNDVQPGDFEIQGQQPKTYAWGEELPPDANRSLSYFGGDLPGLIQRLDYIQELGISALYLNPVFTAYSPHRYDVADYDNVDPHLGGNQALGDLRMALSQRQMRYLLDIVPNHCGFMHDWFRTAQADPNAPEAEFFTFYRHPDEYESWLGVWRLPKLNYHSQELRDRIYRKPDSLFRKWLQAPYAADGWRVDVGNMLGRQGRTQLNAEITRDIRDAVKETRPDAYLMGENFFDASPQLQGDQYDGVMNYMGFGDPLLHWLRGYRQDAWGFEGEIASPHFSTHALEASWRTRRASIPWVIALQQFNLLGSHDTSRLRTMLGEDDALHRLAVVLLMTFPGVPCIFYGDEIGLTDVPVMKSRGCMPWDESEWNQDLRAFYQSLIQLRRGSPILQSGGFQVLAVEEDTLAFQREDASGRVIVIAHRAESPRPAGPLPVADGGIVDGTRFTEHFSGSRAVVSAGHLPLPALPRGATIWKTDAAH
jgi:alpha-glucosidase